MAERKAPPAATAETGTPPGAVSLPVGTAARNPVQPLDRGWVLAARVDPSATSRRIAALAASRRVAPERQAAWLLRAVHLIDLTTLSGDDTPGRVRRLCAKALHPLRPDLAAALGATAPRVAAVCVHHDMLAAARAALDGSGLPLAAVSTGFPSGLAPFPQRLAEIAGNVAAGATEIDIVIARRHVLTGDWAALHAEIAAFREACGPAHMKAILGTGELGSLTAVARASRVAMLAGADFIKTSTGKEAVNATLPVALTMARAIRDHAARSGHAVGFKPAGGISTAPDALRFMALMREELGPSWLHPSRFRFGASSLLGDLERRLDNIATGQPASTRRHAPG